MNRDRSRSFSTPRSQRGSVLIIVMWICLGLVSLTIYFAGSMNSELRAADNRVNETAARQAIAGGARYAAYVLKTYATDGTIPLAEDYRAEAMPVGDATFWFIGRNHDEPPQGTNTGPYFGLVDEASKLNLNTVTSAMPQALPLPDMTPEFADGIVAWRTANGQNAVNANNIYAQMNPPRRNKGAAYESVDELRLIDGATLDLILGEDTNRNGVLEPNEDDGETSAPRDDQNGQLLAGLLEYVTVYSNEPTTSASGSPRIDVSTLNTPAARTRLQNLLTQRRFPAARVQTIMQLFNNNNAPTSVADLMLTSGMTEDEFALVHADLANPIRRGLVNVNTASQAVLACIPGIGPENAASLVAYRLSHPDPFTSFFWITRVLQPAAIRQAGRWITDQSYQFTADIAAVGKNGRGYSREKIVFDASTATPRIVYRQDLTAFGWALGTTTKRTLRTPKDT